MRVSTGTISNCFGFLVTGGLLTMWALMPAPRPAQIGQGAPAGEMTVALAEPEPEKPAEPPAVEQKAEEQPPPPPEPETPPPPPPPPEPEPPPELEREDDKAEPAEQLLDEDGAPVKAPPEALVVVSEEDAAAFKQCLHSRTYYPSTREAKKLKPHGVVALKILIVDANVVGIEITQSSGSPILDQAARSSVLNSGCASKGKVSGIVVTSIRY